MREKAQRAKRNGITIQDRALGEPRLARRARCPGSLAPMSNLVNANRLLRKVNEKVARHLRASSRSRRSRAQTVRGLAREAQAAAEAPARPAPSRSSRRASATTTSRARRRDACASSRRTATRVERAARRTCCGMPNLDGGDIDAARRRRGYNVAQLLPLVEKGCPIVVPGPTCSYTMKKEWPELLGTPEAKKVAASTFDVDGVPGAPAPREEARADFTKGSARSRTTRPVTSARRRSARPARASSASSPTPRSTSSRSAPPSTAPGA